MHQTKNKQNIPLKFPASNESCPTQDKENPLDSSGRVINDILINGRLEFLNKRGIGEDSLKVLEGKGKLYLDMLDIEIKK
ncbi:hypothetical protein [Sinomicrobium sp. M5D2P9]